MKKILLLIFVLLSSQLFLRPALASDDAVEGFVALLVSKEAVSLGDYAKFYGEASEQELVFELQECKKRGWSSDSQDCVAFTRTRWASSQTEPSFFMRWVKSQYSTAGQKYEVIRSVPSAEGFPHALVEVRIGDHKFVLFRNLAPDRPTGLLVGIRSIDGQPVLYTEAEVAGARRLFSFSKTGVLPSGRSYSIKIAEQPYVRAADEKADDGSRWGIDGGFSDSYCALFELVIAGKPVRIARKLFVDLSHLSDVLVFEKNGLVEIVIHGGDAAGSFEATYTIRRFEIERVVRHGEVPEEIWERVIVHNEFNKILEDEFPVDRSPERQQR